MPHSNPQILWIDADDTLWENNICFERVISQAHPAIAAGMKAVYIPHPPTWVLEHEDPVEHPNLICPERFSDLRDYF